MSFADYTASRYDVRCQRGDTLTEQFTFSDDDGEELDLAGYTFTSQVRRNADAPLTASFAISISGGTVTRTLNSATTASLDGTYVQDLQWVDPGGKTRTLLSGDLEIVDDVTR